MPKGSCLALNPTQTTSDHHNTPTCKLFLLRSTRFYWQHRVEAIGRGDSRENPWLISKWTFQAGQSMGHRTKLTWGSVPDNILQF